MNRELDFRVMNGDHRCVLGEGPLWLPESGALLWVDILDPTVHRVCVSTGATDRWTIPENIGWLIPRRSAAGFVAGLRAGFVELSLEPFAMTTLVELPAHRANARLRLNDAKADALGRIFAGTMDMDGRTTGELLRLDCDRSIHVVDTGYGVTNGPTFSPDGRTLYHADSRARQVYAFDVGSDGALANRRSFVRFPAEWGAPDGMTTDAEGFIWIAHWGGSRVSRFNPAGELDRFIRLPTPQITSCVFGGHGLDCLFVTSASLDLVDDAFAGCVFEVDPGCKGLTPHRFAG